MERTDKTEHILEAAIRRFAHFGVQKTTLTEIADDLGITKQALAYYFPDKQALADAVQQKIVNEFFSLLNTHVAAVPTTEQAILEVVEVKKTFFEKYAMLVKAVGPEVIAMNQVTESRQKVKVKVVEIIAALLEAGVAKGEFAPMNTAETANLIYDTIAAYEQCFIGRQVVPDPNNFSEMCQRQKAVLQLIINGLKQA